MDCRTRGLFALLLMLGLGGCQTTGEVRPGELRAGQRPTLDSDEAGLWAAADKSEKAIRESGRVVSDPAINRYVGDIVCRIVPEHCADIRVDVIRTPNFNASMSPNGHMQVWTGLLLRAENEDQLAYVLGHEVAHYLRRHSVQRWRAIRATTDATSFFQILTAAAGVPVVGQVGTYLALGGVMAYSRDHEREADEQGLAMVTRAGYDPTQAHRVWEALMAERDAENKPEQSIFFATHPSAAERVDTLRTLASAQTAVARRQIDASRHRAILRQHARVWLDDELRKREHAANLLLIDRLAAIGYPTALLDYYRGEVYRLRGGEGDDPRAIAAYRDAIGRPGTPVQAHRSLGLVLWRSGRDAEAREAFEAYLAAAPDADDRRMVSSYLSRIGD